MKRTRKLIALLISFLMLSTCILTSCDETVPGPPGEKGDKGDQGEQGIQGEQGEAGNGIATIELTSSDGLIDTYTITFTDGSTTTFTVTNGEKGDKGEQGIQGEKGDKGDQGEQGTQGEKGEKGDQGEQGTQGEKGDKGDQGEQGIQGEKGEKGESGLSAYEIYLKYHPGYKDTEEDWINGYQHGELAPETGEFVFAKNLDGVSYALVSYTGVDRRVDVPSTYKGYPVTIIGGGAFNHPEKVEKVVLPSTIITIEGQAFVGCKNLSEIIINNAVSIGSYAFNMCDSLTSVVLPSSLEYISPYAFYSFPLPNILYMGTKEQWQQIVIEDKDLNTHPIHFVN